MSPSDFQIYNQIKKIYLNRIPVVFIEHGSVKMKKTKYLVPNNVTVSELLMAVRKQVNLNRYQALFLFVDKGVCLSATDNVGAVYEKYKDNSGLLYIKYDVENTFG